MTTKTLWTAWGEYGATGEGETLMVWIGYASSAEEAKSMCTARFGEFFESCCIVEEGVVRNEVVTHLIPVQTLDWLAGQAGKANIDFFSKLQVNAA